MFGTKEEYTELKDNEQTKAKKIPIHVEKLQEYADSGRIQQKLRDGVVMMVKVKDLKEKNLPELKRAIERIKRTCSAVGGDIAGVGNDWIIVSPANAKIDRTKRPEF